MFMLRILYDTEAAASNDAPGPRAAAASVNAVWSAGAASGTVASSRERPA